MTELEQMLMKKLELADEQNKQLTEQLALLTEQVQLLTQKLFGRSSEKSKTNTPVENQLSLFTDADLNIFNEAEVSQDKKASEISHLQEIKVKKRTVGQKEKLIKNLPIINVNCMLHEDECHCEWCNTELKIIGKEEVRQEIEFIPAHLKVRKIMRYAYECPTCKKDGADNIVKAVTPAPVIPRSLASASSVAWLMHQKFELSVPFYRQEKEWENYGIALSRATMANWVIKASNQWLKPIFDLLHQQLLHSRAIHVDETTMQVLKEPGKKATTKSYMWLYQSSKDSPEQIALYQYKPTRAGENARKFLEGYRGFMHCDGYEGYNKVTEVTRVGCWAHLRRKFNDGIPKNAMQNKSQSEIGKDFCDQLFKVEREIAFLSPEERFIQRKEKATPILNKFWNWVEHTNALKSSILGKALQYAKNQKPYLMNYLKDGECQLSNNLAERSIRPFVVGRKVWNFSTSTKGATASGVVYSIIQTAKVNGLSPYKYLQYLFEELPTTPFKEEPELLQNLLPWSKEVQESCK
ncbi:IS66 family transposase [Mycobacteroides abscessus]|uniref:IS66 family transposase n=1 Tax=Desemzia sp. FAM 23989 TaxID=3259523 RepID=UPI0009C93C04|nr:Transposase and inactivated derivatives [Mycobacteroides abscessus subsp. abscessus]